MQHHQMQYPGYESRAEVHQNCCLWHSGAAHKTAVTARFVWAQYGTAEMFVMAWTSEQALEPPKMLITASLTKSAEALVEPHLCSMSISLLCLLMMETLLMSRQNHRMCCLVLLRLLGLSS